ncbi:hypothetical protein [Labrenzia sp. PHM005]|uniref:hypothetical protein n=1 Tax=Labrenzia sp. PHM005 TaxID=2590016 RepID=UPI0011400E2C|nr:hypothetical protein [Labrenzia sp. PHM005]QDG77572.1 hypothetical protein FJ695_17815 [Labrenzia sp. PHM005]
MSEAQETSGEGWTGNKPLVIAWLLIFFPVGFYGLWKGDVFERNWKIGITVLVLIAFFPLGVRFVHPAYVLLAYPVGLYLLWQAPSVRRATFYKFAAAWCAVFVLFAVNNLAGPSGGFEDFGEEGGSCAAVMTQNNCTYYRDSDCNVIARECS